jgi:hypothetical protein
VEEKRVHFRCDGVQGAVFSVFGFWILDFGFWILDFGFWISICGNVWKRAAFASLLEDWAKPIKR